MLLVFELLQESFLDVVFKIDTCFDCSAIIPSVSIPLWNASSKKTMAIIVNELWVDRAHNCEFQIISPNEIQELAN